MARVADEFCNHVFLANKDPYDENPMEIIKQMKEALEKNEPEIVLNRREAINKALSIAKEIVLL